MTDRLLDELEELELEAQEKLRSNPGSVDFQRYRDYYDDPVGFIVDHLTPDHERDTGVRQMVNLGVLPEGTTPEDASHTAAGDYPGFGPWPAQVKIAESVRDNNLTVVRSCNKAGKDWLAARLAVWWVYARGGRVLVTGPTGRQVKKVVMMEVGMAFHASELPGDLYTQELRIDTGETDEFTAILAMTSSSASKLTGFHRTPVPGEGVLILMTEAQDVEEFAWEGLLRNAARDQDRFLAFGNPYEPVGEFYEANLDDEWNAIRIDGLDHPNVVYGEDVVPGGITRGYVERIERQSGGRDTALFKSAVRGEFSMASGDRLIQDPAWIDEAFELHDEVQDLLSGGQLPPEVWRRGDKEGASVDIEDPRRKPLVIGVDVARFGEDSSVLIFRRGGFVTEVKTLPFKTRTTEVSGHVVRALREYGVDKDDRGYVVLVDEIGVGGGVVDELHEQGWRVRGVNFAAGPPAGVKDEYLNLRAWCYWRVRQDLERNQMALPRAEKLRQELLAQSWAPTSAGKIKLNKKSQVRAELGRSPDYADALAITYGAESRASGLGFEATL